MTVVASAQRARWAVGWRSPKTGEVLEKDFEDDLSEAMKFRDKLVAGKRQDVTLRSRNVSWPPPEKYRPHTVVKVKKKKVRGKVRKVKTEVEVNPMRAANAKGIWWCPYCMKFRRFEQASGFKHDGIFVNQPGMYCPHCGISHFDFAVRKYNPQANLLTYRAPRRSTTRRKRGRRA